MSAEKQILVVDDEAPILMLWERFLGRWGYSYDVVETGEEALQRARQTHYQLIVTDLSMPGVSGQELIRTLKAEQPELEVVAITGHGTVQVAVDTMKAGAYDFLTKPINFSYAELIIAKCLEQVQARRENQRLRRLNQDLELLNDVKEKFIAITNHELRTPVSVIGSIADILGREVSEEAAPLVSMLQRSTDQLAEIVDQMHELSQLKTDGVLLQPGRQDVGALCHEVGEEFRLVLERRGHSIRYDVPEALWAEVDRAKFKKVVRELLQNAIKFTQDGGEIAVSAVATDGELRLAVQDTGVGIAPENVERVFQMFYEVGSTLHHHSSKEDFQGGGMGIGLTIVHDIVEAHGGRVEVESQPGRGSRFTVCVPQRGAAGEGASEAQEGNLHDAHG